MSMLSLKSSNSDAAVNFSDVEGDRFRVSVVARDHSVSRIVYAYTDALGVAALFAQAAQEWKGWDGAKVWQSIEGELRLRDRPRSSWSRDSPCSAPVRPGWRRLLAARG